MKPQKWFSKKSILESSFQLNSNIVRELWRMKTFLDFNIAEGSARIRWEISVFKQTVSMPMHEHTTLKWQDTLQLSSAIPIKERALFGMDDSERVTALASLPWCPAPNRPGQLSGRTCHRRPRCSRHWCARAVTRCRRGTSRSGRCRARPKSPPRT